MVIYTSVKASELERLEGVQPVRDIQGHTPDAAPDRSETSPFGPAYVRESSRDAEESPQTYGPDARMVNKLEDRDRQVRQDEAAKGEAVGNSNYIYKVGPDGKRYAVGTGPHAVRAGDDPGEGPKPRGADGKEMSEGDEDLLARLEARDAKVRAHEAAHVTAAGGQAQGLPTYTYQTGPDGRRYAVGGSVNISMMTSGDDEANARRARKAYRAAMATGEPSSRDMQTAMEALARANEAQSGFAFPGTEQPETAPA